MTRDEFISRVKEELSQMLPEELTRDLDIQETVVLKSNDQKHHGLTFKRGESEAAPTIYLDDAYARFTEGEETLYCCLRVMGLLWMILKIKFWDWV